jgi:hypothetical protein
MNRVSSSPCSPSHLSPGTLDWGNSLPQRQHLLLVSGVAVCLNERTHSDGQPLSLTSSHILHFNGDDFRHISNPTFFHIQRQNSNRSNSEKSGAPSFYWKMH